MAVYTCGVGGDRAEARTILSASGTVEAIVCPNHGVLTYLGFKPTSGDAGVRAPDGTRAPEPGQYAKVGNRWLACPPRGEPLWLGVPVTANADQTITVAAFIHTNAWRGWLENGNWIEEER